MAPELLLNVIMKKQNLLFM